jgi:hypothetical protein
VACPRVAQKSATYRSPRYPSVTALVPSAGTLKTLKISNESQVLSVPVSGHAVQRTCLNYAILPMALEIEMTKYLPATLGIAAVLIASSALAKERSALESASVKAASDCVAAAALNNPNITTLYRENRLKEVTNWIVLQSSACDNQLTAMRLLHDRLYGVGTGRTFLLGDYLADLPRAVGERIGGEVAKRIASESGDDALKGYAMQPGSKDLGVIQGRSSFRPKKPEPLEKYTSLECVPVQATDRDRRDPIYKISVTISLDDNWQPEDMSVSHYATSGASYNRADQYTRSDLTQTAGKSDYYWTGTWLKNPAITMRGNLMRSTTNKWTYSEQQFKYGRPEFAMFSVCHIESE